MEISPTGKYASSRIKYTDFDEETWWGRDFLQNDLEGRITANFCLIVSRGIIQHFRSLEADDSSFDFIVNKI